MTRTNLLVAALVCACFVASVAHARSRHGHSRNIPAALSGCSDPVMRPCGQFAKSQDYFSVSLQKYKKRRNDSRIHRSTRTDRSHLTGGARPRAWCGWWLGRHLGMTDRKLWLARNWVHVGRPAYGPHIGAIVVWATGRRSGHVGIITGKTARGWVVKSGNDGHAVRERVRSVSNAIAFRWPS